MGGLSLGLSFHMLLSPLDDAAAASQTTKRTETDGREFLVCLFVSKRTP